MVRFIHGRGKSIALGVLNNFPRVLSLLNNITFLELDSGLSKIDLNTIGVNFQPVSAKETLHPIIFSVLCTKSQQKTLFKE
jgi:hypothetical protein